MLATGGNLGFGAACNLGAERARGELLLLLNPDAMVASGFRDAIELPLLEERGWDAWQALITAEDGAVINTWGGVTHFTCISWAGGAGRPASEAPTEPRDVAYASGACLAIRRSVWGQVGGFSPEYFLYHEDTDLGLRLWLGGGSVGVEPRARCDHDYEFHKGAHKWYFLERNRLATIVRTYPTRLLLPLLPALLATELALLVAAGSGGWLGEKLRAWRDFARSLPRLIAERREIRARSVVVIDAGRFAELLTPGLDSEYLGAAARSGLLAGLLAGYWRLVRLITG